MTAYVVESPAINQRGTRVGTMRVYVATEARALALVAESAERSYRSVDLQDLPAAVRAGLLGGV